MRPCRRGGPGDVRGDQGAGRPQRHPRRLLVPGPGDRGRGLFGRRALRTAARRATRRSRSRSSPPRPSPGTISASTPPARRCATTSGASSPGPRPAAAVSQARRSSRERACWWPRAGPTRPGASSTRCSGPIRPTRRRCSSWPRGSSKRGPRTRRVALARRAVALWPRSALARSGLARCLHALHDDDAALAEAQEALRLLDEGDNLRHAAPVYLTLVWCLREKRLLREALADRRGRPGPGRRRRSRPLGRNRRGGAGRRRAGGVLTPSPDRKWCSSLTMRGLRA